MPTFDIVSELDQHELENAIQQASKEVSTRFDFRGTDTTIERHDDGIMVKASGEGRLEAAYGVLAEKCAKRKINPRSLDPQKAEAGSKGAMRQLVKLKQGISKEKAKELIQFIKDGKFKVQSSIQGEQLRITGKKRDELQEVIQALRAHDFEQDLQFTNFRD
jgi:cyclic-di-GMP-binding protein